MAQYVTGNATNLSNILSPPIPKFSGPTAHGSHSSGSNNHGKNLITGHPYITPGTATAASVYSPALMQSQVASHFAYGSPFQPSRPLQQLPYPTAASQYISTSHPTDTLIESQDINMAEFYNQAEFPFIFSNDFNPYLEYLPPDVINFFGDSNSSSHPTDERL